MRIVKPSVELITYENEISHIANCARICRAGKFTSTTKDKELFDNLIYSEHYSMLRHATHYYVVPLKYMDEGGSELNTFYNDFYYSPFVAHKYNPGTETYLFSINLHFLFQHPDVKELLEPYRVTEKEFDTHEMSKYIKRYSFCIVTQVSTSRELNRVSPNNIVEESTRYCNYSKDRFGNEVTICQPHWFDLFDGMNNPKEIIYNKQNSQFISIYDDEKNLTVFDIIDVPIKMYKYNTDICIKYLKACASACKEYLELIDDEVLPQDARGVLDLDVATKVIYTYTYEEWCHILDLRYYGTTGAPHPNAKLVANMIRQQLYDLGYTELHA